MASNVPRGSIKRVDVGRERGLRHRLKFGAVVPSSPPGKIEEIKIVADLSGLRQDSGQFCRHAKGSLEEVLQAAVAQRFEVFGLSEHAPRYRSQDLYPEESDLTPADLESTFLTYLDTAHGLRKRYSDRLSIPIGLETDFISSADPAGLDALLRREWARVDYVVGSLHHVNEIPIDFDKATFDRALNSYLPVGSATPPSKSETEAALTALLHAYFDNQLALLEHNRPEVVGHFDLIRLWSPALRFRDYDGVWSKIRRNVEFAVGYGALFELNAAAFRKGWDEAYPSFDVLELILELNGRLCLSDDSHGPAAVGLNYGRLRAYLEARNVRCVWYLDIDLALEPVQPAADVPFGQWRSGRATPRLAADGWLERQEFWGSRT